eukprot:5213285-Pyramimonas_sp.AAC.1
MGRAAECTPVSCPGHGQHVLLRIPNSADNHRRPYIDDTTPSYSAHIHRLHDGIPSCSCGKRGPWQCCSAWAS